MGEKKVVKKRTRVLLQSSHKPPPDETRTDDKGNKGGVKRADRVLLPPGKRQRIGGGEEGGGVMPVSEQPGASAVEFTPSTKEAAFVSVKSKNVCKSCNKKFPSTEAFDLHTKMKVKTLSKVRIESNMFKPRSQMVVCHYLDCCFTSESVQNMSIHLASGKHGTKKHMIASGALKIVNKRIEASEVYVIQRGPLAAGASALTCPTCQTHVSTSEALARHVKHGCHGIAVWSCPHCGLQCQSMSSLHKHMAARHPLPPSLNLTGVFRGKTKQRKVGGVDRWEGRKGQIKAGVDMRAVEAFTFLAKKTSCLTAEDVFAEGQRENLHFLIERAKGGNGAFTLNINTASLLLTSNSRKLELFNTQSPLQVYSSTADTEHVLNKVLLAVNIASRQAADASSGLSLHTIKSVTLSFAAKSGHRGAGGKKSPFTASTDWANAKTIRGCVSVQVTLDNVKRDPSCKQRCFQQAILHNMFHKTFSEKQKEKQAGICEKNKHKKYLRDRMCTHCERVWERETENCVPRKRGSFKPPVTLASSYDEYIGSLNWTGIDFPTGI